VEFVFARVATISIVCARVNPWKMDAARRETRAGARVDAQTMFYIRIIERMCGDACAASSVGVEKV
jgi:hypothetical protein